MNVDSTYPPPLPPPNYRKQGLAGDPILPPPLPPHTHLKEASRGSTSYDSVVPPPLPPSNHRRQDVAGGASFPPPLSLPNRPKQNASGSTVVAPNDSVFPPPLPPPNRPKRSTVNSTSTWDSWRVQSTNSHDETPYANIKYTNGCPDMTDVPLSPDSGIVYQPNYVNIPTLTSHTGTGIKTEVEEEQGYENQPPRIKLEPVSPLTKERSRTYVPLTCVRHLPPRQVVSECSQCRDLLEWLSLWELGVSGLTRQYSQILAQLNHVRNAATIIECKMQEEWSKREESEGHGDSEEVKPPRKLSSVEEGISGSTNSITDQMYPQRNKANGGADPPQLPGDYSQHFTDLTTHLGRAIDLCQQLAASSFKNQTSSIIKMKMKTSLKRNIQRQSSTPVTPELVRKSQPTLLERLTEEPSATKVSASKRRRGLLTRMETEPAFTSSGTGAKMESSEVKIKSVDSPVPGYTKAGLSRSNTQCMPSKDKPAKSSIAGDLFDGGKLEVKVVRSHLMPSPDKVRKTATEGEGDGGESEGSSSSYQVAGSSDSDEGEGPLTRHGSSFSDADVKQVMSKIALLEDERLRLLETVDQMQTDNQNIRLSLYETLGDLENKDLQLTLAMQDLSIATDEIKRVAGLRAKLDTMEREREHTLDKLSALEDESSAVKVSLIQLLQEKSATNKTLALENWRLRQTVRQSGSLSRTNSRSSSTRDSHLTDSCLKDEDLSNYVHKQGFLIKQGRRVKSWKRRLFVLDSDGLSYYRTEQPIQKVSLSEIKKIQVAHNQVILPHMFEVHTPERVFFLSAPSEDEMQSWIGMLQTLKQYARHGSPTPGVESIQNGTTASAILRQIAMENGATVTKGKSSTLPATAGITVQTEDEENGTQIRTNHIPDPVLKRKVEDSTAKGMSNGADTRRPRSQAFMMSKPLSLDEAIPQSSRPMSALVTMDPETEASSMEWEQGESNETSPSHQSNDSAVDYNKVLSKSHPGTTGHHLTIPNAVFET